MRLVVAAETAGIIGVAEIVRIGSPGDFEVRKYVALVDSHQCLCGKLDIVRTFGPDIAIFLLVKAAEGGGDFLSGADRAIQANRVIASGAEGRAFRPEIGSGTGLDKAGIAKIKVYRVISRYFWR